MGLFRNSGKIETLVRVRSHSYFFFPRFNTPYIFCVSLCQVCPKIRAQERKFRKKVWRSRQSDFDLGKSLGTHHWGDTNVLCSSGFTLLDELPSDLCYKIHEIFLCQLFHDPLPLRCVHTLWMQARRKSEYVVETSWDGENMRIMRRRERERERERESAHAKRRTGVPRTSVDSFRKLPT